MARLRYNGLSNSLGAALTSGGTTITFASKLTYAGGDVPTITGSDYIPLSILDADGKCAEVVHLTAYTSAATTGTIARGKEDTSGVAHDSGAVVVNGPTVADASPIADSRRALGSTSANYMTTSTTEVDIDATNLAVSLPAAVGDQVEVVLTLNAWASSAAYMTFQIASNGTAVADCPVHTGASFEPRSVILANVVTVTSGMLSGGAMPIKAQYKTSAGVLTVANSGSNRPVLAARVLN